MRLPGGVWREQGIHPQFSFKPITGEVELMLAECATQHRHRPEQVTAVLQAVLQELGEDIPGPEQVDALSVGDRQYLMRQLAIALGFDHTWLSAVCGQCGEHFDIELWQSQLPVKSATGEYPFAETTTSLGDIRLRVPTGRDQQAVASIDDPRQALRQLIGLCLVEPAGIDPQSFNDDDMQAMDAALEKVAPEVATEVEAKCPHCQATNMVPLDPYFCLGKAQTTVFTDIHQLAMNYHWSEADILALPRTRRAHYLKLLDRARGMLR